MKVTIIPIVIGAFGTVTKGLLKGLEDLEVGGRVETYPNNSIIEDGQNTEKSPEKRLEETCCRSNFSERPSANADVKNSKGVNNNNNNDNDNNNKPLVSNLDGFEVQVHHNLSKKRIYWNGFSVKIFMFGLEQFWVKERKKMAFYKSILRK